MQVSPPTLESKCANLYTGGGSFLHIEEGFQQGCRGGYKKSEYIYKNKLNNKKIEKNKTKILYKTVL